MYNYCIRLFIFFFTTFLSAQNPGNVDGHTLWLKSDLSHNIALAKVKNDLKTIKATHFNLIKYWISKSQQTGYIKIL